MTITWKPRANGDIIVGTLDAPVIASWFGGDNDPLDDGSTASGIFTKGNHGLMGCALPMRKSNGVLVPNCANSPLPNMPYRTTMVEISARTTGRDPATGQLNFVTFTVPLIDVGPADKEDRPIDLTQATFLALGGNLDKGLLPVMFIIKDAGQYIFS